MKYLGAIFFLFLLWVTIFLVLAAVEENDLPEENAVYTVTEPSTYAVYDTDYSDREGLIYNYAPIVENGEILITVSALSGETETVALEEYLVGTVFAEMPAKFEPDALKAQAVAVRSYCYYKMAHRSVGESDNVHPNADVCDDYTHCKAYISYESACEKYGEDYAGEAFATIREAVNATKNEILIYENEPALAVFHAMSASNTESASNVWGGDVPYLISAPTPEDLTTENIFSETTITDADLLNVLINAGYECVADSRAPSLIRNDSGRVESVEILGATVTGVEFRKLLSLRSADFSIAFDVESNQYVISVYGSGHGVGMSQRGANLLALDGYSYRDILFRYYSGVELFTLERVNGG